MTGRRNFIHSVGAASIASLGWPHAATMNIRNSARRLERIGLQLYTVRAEMQKNVERTLERVAAIGYDEVQFAGYFERTPQQIRAVLEMTGLDAPAAHVSFESLERGWGNVLDQALSIGHRYVVIAWIPEPRRQTLDDYYRIADRFNVAAYAARQRDLIFAYHNYAYDFAPIEGRLPYDVIIERTDPELVKVEIDLFWMIKGDQDPLQYFKRLPGRVPMLHVKDMDEHAQMVDVGDGRIDFATILAHSVPAGVEHFFAEHDEPKDPFASARASLEYLRALEF